MGADGRKSSREGPPRVPRPGPVTAPPVSRTIVGVAPAANGSHVPPAQGALSGLDDAPTAEDLPAELADALDRTAVLVSPAAAPAPRGAAAEPLSGPSTDRMEDKEERTLLTTPDPRLAFEAVSAAGRSSKASASSPSLMPSPRSPSGAFDAGRSLTGPFAPPPLRSPSSPVAALSGGFDAGRSPTGPFAPPPLRSPSSPVAALSPMPFPARWPSAPPSSATMPAALALPPPPSPLHLAPSAAQGLREPQLSYQVFAGDSGARSPHEAVAETSAIAARPRPSMSLGARVCLVLVGVCVVVGTASLVAMGTAEDPRAQAAQFAPVPLADPPSPLLVPSAVVAPPVPATEAPSASSSPSPPPSAEAPGTASASPPSPVPAATVAKVPTKVKPPASAGAPALRGVAVPPNPFAAAADPPKPPRKR